MDWKNYTAKTVDEALNNAMHEMGVTAENLEYEIIEKETNGFLGMFGKPAKIRVGIKISVENIAKKFLDDVFATMGINAVTEVTYDAVNVNIDINVKGEEMGVLIGKRGQTLDSLQYLVSLVINKNSENYIKVKLDTENYRARRKETLENLAKNIAYKVKKTRKPVSLEPMNPYERRIIHSALQNDKFVETYSEGEEPYRKVVINIKKGTYDAKYPSKNKDYKPEYKSNYIKTNSTTNNNSSSNTSNNNSNNTSYNTSSNTSNNTSYNNGSNTSNNNGSNTSNNNSNNTSYNNSSNTSRNNTSNSNTSNSNNKSFNNNYSKDYRKDYKEYRESKEKVVPAEEV